jgi:hypothetical protein
MPGAALAPAGLRYGRLSQTAWARKVPEGHHPQPLGDHRADGAAKVDWVARGRHGSDGAQPCRVGCQGMQGPVGCKGLFARPCGGNPAPTAMRHRPRVHSRAPAHIASRLNGVRVVGLRAATIRSSCILPNWSCTIARSTAPLSKPNIRSRRGVSNSRLGTPISFQCMLSRLEPVGNRPCGTARGPYIYYVIGTTGMTGGEAQIVRLLCAYVERPLRGACRCAYGALVK